jgi:hypothetical protein
MSTALRSPTRPRPDAVELESQVSLRSDPRYQAFLLLRTGFTVLPIIMGLDKFFNLRPWSRAGARTSSRPGSPASSSTWSATASGTTSPSATSG